MRSATNNFFSRDSQEVTYEELITNVKCPTCQGKGNIPRDSREEYIALIPLSDKRLQPHRTALKVVIAVLFCVFICGLLLFFLLPRSIHLTRQSELIQPDFVIVEKLPPAIYMGLKIPVNLTNGNYVSISVNKITVEVSFDNVIVLTSENNSILHIPLRQQQVIDIYANVTLAGPDYSAYTWMCTYPAKKIRILNMHFTFTVSASVLNQEIEATLAISQSVDCSPTNSNNTLPFIEDYF